MKVQNITYNNIAFGRIPGRSKFSGMANVVINALQPGQNAASLIRLADALDPDSGFENLVQSQVRRGWIFPGGVNEFVCRKRVETGVFKP